MHRSTAFLFQLNPNPNLNISTSLRRQHVIENIMFKMNEAEDEAVAKGDEIAELRIQLRKAEVEKNRADDKIEMLTADKEEAEANSKEFQEQINATIREYEMKIDSITMKYLDKIEKLNNEKADSEDQLHDLQDKHDKTVSDLKAAESELSTNKYERRIENLENDLDSTVQTFDRKIQSLENELTKVHDDNDGLARERQKLTVHVRNLEADRDEANSARQKMIEQLNIEREDHDANMDETTASFSQVSHF